MNLFSLVVTSGVIPIPLRWMDLPRARVAVSIDGLPEHHDIRRKPATYDRILKNIEGREINVHWVITRPMLERQSYLEDYVSFWNARPEVSRILVSLYTPQIGQQSAEMLSPDNRERIARELPLLHHKFPKLLMNPGIGRAFVEPPTSPSDCLFPKCRSTIPPTSTLASSPASSAARRTVRSAAAPPAAAFTGSATKKLSARCE
jgi:MoaA/NifB/PqqE/SkfB family radical SAM enzyme